MNNNYLYLSILALFSAVPATAQEVTIGSTVQFESEYVFRGIQLADETFMGALDFTVDDFYLGIWTAQPITNGIDNEIDFYGGYGASLNEKIGLDTGLTVYHYPETNSSSTTEVFAGFTYDTELSPAVYFYYDFDLEVFTTQLEVSYSYNANDKTSYGITAHLGYVSPDVGSSGYYYDVSADASYAFSESASISFGIRSSGNDDLAVKKSNAWWGINFSSEF